MKNNMWKNIFLSFFDRTLWLLHDTNTVYVAQALTSNIFEVDGLSVGVEQLDYRVIIVLHSAAYGGHFPLNHRHIVSRQVLTFNFRKQTNTEWKINLT